MKYLSIDIETTGLQPSKHCIIQVAAVLADTTVPYTDISTCPAQSWWVKLPTCYAWDDVAFKMHKQSGLADRHSSAVMNNEAISSGEILERLITFAKEQGLEPRFNIAGKNFGSFDLQFLEKIEPWDKVIRHRILDPGSLFVRIDDEKVPSLDECKQRAGITTPVVHDALADAIDVARVVNFALQQNP